MLLCFESIQTYSPNIRDGKLTWKPLGCAAFGLTNPGGAVAGNGKQVWLQIVGGLFIIGWNIVWTSLIMCFIKFVLRVPLRMSQEMLEVGDYAVHGEEPYTFARKFRPALSCPVPDQVFVVGMS